MKAFSTRHGRWTAALFTGLLVVGLGAIGQADAGEVVDGNPTCDGYDHGVKFENPSGTLEIDRDGLHLTMTVGTYPDVSEPNPDNAVVSYLVHPDSEVTSGRIIVKGSSGAILYEIGESAPLHSPVLENGKWPSISHVQVCWNDPEPPEYGRIELTKAVAGEGAPTDVDFELCITGPQPDDTQQCETIGAGETATFEDLVPGTYAVTETDPGDHWTTTSSDDTITVAADQTGTATVTNTWEEQEQLPPVTPVTPVTPVAPVAPVTPPTDVSPSGGTLPTTLPTTGSSTLAIAQAGIAAGLLAVGSALLRLAHRPERRVG